MFGCRVSRIALVTITLVLCMLAASPAIAATDILARIQRHGELRVGFAEGYMPFEMVDRRSGIRERLLLPSSPRYSGQSAHFIGFDLDIAQLLAEELGVRLAPVNMRFTELIDALFSGRIDIILSGMSITPERQARVDFSDSYMTVGQTVLLSSRHRGRVSSYLDLNSAEFVVASPPGTTGAEAVRTLLPNATYLPIVSEADAIAAVRSGDADAFVYDRPHNAIAFALNPTDDLVFLDEPFTSEQIAAAIRKGNPDYLNRLNGLIAALKADGRYQVIYERWFKQTDWYDRVR